MTVFFAAFSGRFEGIRTWPQLDALWDAVRRDSGWYAYTLEKGPPAAPSGADEIATFVLTVDARLRKDHPRDYCGFVYADNPNAPSFIKVFEPKKFSGCGLGPGPALPSWILCKIPPTDLTAATAMPQSWWRKALIPFA